MAHATAKLTVTIGCADYYVETDFRFNPGEPEVRYFADGSGYPGSPAEIDSIDRVKLLECERSKDGTVFNTQPENWGYSSRDDLIDEGVDVADIERLIIFELESGAYDSELLEGVEYAS